MLFELNLFDSKKEIFVFLLLALFVFGTNLFLKYILFKELKEKNIVKVQAEVINQYKKEKNNKSYIVLKLRSKDGYIFYTTSKEDLKDLYSDDLSLKIFTKNISFLDMFRGFYAPSFDLRIYKKDYLKRKIIDFISKQHENSLTKELFLALFLAKPISKELREKITNFGISHLIAISGFHLGVLFFIIYFIFEKPYKFLQDRFFPYRNIRLDLSIFAFFVLFFYLYLLGFVPSLIRSYVMLVVGFFLYDRFFKVISFEVLFVAVVLILAFLPEFFFSIAFWFSVFGVFFIYLFLKYFSHLKSWVIFIFLNIWVFIAMLPIVHFVFDKFTSFTLLSPIFSMIFVVFYPLELFLHLINQGDLLDPLILKLLSIEPKIYHFKTSIFFLVFYLLFGFYFAFKRQNKKI